MARRADISNGTRSEMSEDQLELLYKIFWSDTLEYYDAESELSTIRKWYRMVKTPLNERSSIKKLQKEAEKVSGMFGSFREAEAKAMAERKYDVFPFLTRAECIAVMMYTGDSQRSFYSEYNEASRNEEWKPFKVYTTLLLSALMKLAKENPLPSGKTLYRGIREHPDPPTDRRIFWKSFTSASLSAKVAKDKFAGPDGVVLKFKTLRSGYAAQVGKLSSFSEDEVILIPFEAFDVVDAQKFMFKTSKTQELLDARNA